MVITRSEEREREKEREIEKRKKRKRRVIDDSSDEEYETDLIIKKRKLESTSKEKIVVNELEHIIDNITPYVSDNDEELNENNEEVNENDREEYIRVSNELEEIEEELNNVYDSNYAERERVSNIGKEDLKRYTKTLKSIVNIYKESNPSILKVLDSNLTLNDKAMLMERIVLYKNLDDIESKIVEREYINRYIKENSYRSKEELEKINEIENKLKNNDKNADSNGNNEEMLKVKIVNLNTTEENRLVIYRKYQEYLESLVHQGDSGSIIKWLNSIVSIPFGNYSSELNKSNDGEGERDGEDIYEYLKNAREILDNGIGFMEQVKEEIMNLMALNKNGFKKVRSIALKGSPGIGKTRVGKLIATAMGRKYVKISLGGLKNACILKGSNGVWQGSSMGLIVQSLRDVGCMDPIIHFDELDKLAEGEDITGVLMHLIDETQVNSYTDEYFQGVTFDLSRCLFIFSYNDEHLISSILSDRMQKIDIKSPSTREKIIITQRYMLPEILKEYGYNNNEFIFEERVIRYIINKSKVNEEGCRQLRRNIDTIMMRLNMCYLVQKSGGDIKEIVKDNYVFNKKIEIPYEVLEEDIDKLFYEPIGKSNSSERLNHLYI